MTKSIGYHRAFNAEAYWNRRYTAGGTSGAGSEGYAATQKAETVGGLVADYGIASIIDWGSGDGTVAAEILERIYPSVIYTGVDISTYAVEHCKHKFFGVRNARFYQLDVADNLELEAELALSLDVVFHLIHNRDYKAYLHRLFNSASRFVAIHSSDHNGGQTAPHVRWRRWTPDVAEWFPDWRLTWSQVDPEAIGWYLYEKETSE